MLPPRSPRFLLLLLTFLPVCGTVSVERQKRQLLKAFNLPHRPDFIRQPPLIPYALGRQHDLYGGVMDKFMIEAERKDWNCQTPEALVTNCFQYSLSSIHHEVISASLVLNTLFSSNDHANATVIIYEVDELFGETHFMDSFDIKGHQGAEEGTGVMVTFDVTSQVQNWRRRRQNGKMIKIELLSSSRLSTLSLHDSLLLPPHFEITVFHPNSSPSDSSSSQCSSGCCVVPFYVNFTEIGWDDWILSPPGFYANFCSGSCSADSDETYQFMKASVSDPSMLPAPTCVPNYYGSVDFVIALGPRDIRKTRVHGMRALSCSCS